MSHSRGKTSRASVTPVSKTLNDVRMDLNWSPGHTHDFLPWLLDHFSCYLAKAMEKTAFSMYHFQILYILCTCTHTHAHTYKLGKGQSNRRIKI